MGDLGAFIRPLVVTGPIGVFSDGLSNSVDGLVVWVTPSRHRHVVAMQAGVLYSSFFSRSYRQTNTSFLYWWQVTCPNTGWRPRQAKHTLLTDLLSQQHSGLSISRPGALLAVSSANQSGALLPKWALAVCALPPDTLGQHLLCMEWAQLLNLLHTPLSDNMTYMYIKC